MGWAIVIALPVTIGLAMVAVPEPVTTGGQPHGSLGAYLSLFKKPVVRKLLLSDLLLGVAPGITGSLLFFFFGQIRGYDHTQAGLFMLFYFVAGLCGAPFWAWYATRVGKDRGLAVASVVSAVLLCLRDPGSGRQLRPDGRGHVHRRPALCGLACS